MNVFMLKIRLNVFFFIWVDSEIPCIGFSEPQMGMSQLNLLCC